MFSVHPTNNLIISSSLLDEDTKIEDFDLFDQVVTTLPSHTPSSFPVPPYANLNDDIVISPSTSIEKDETINQSTEQLCFDSSTDICSLRSDERSQRQEFDSKREKELERVTNDLLSHFNSLHYNSPTYTSTPSSSTSALQSDHSYSYSSEQNQKQAELHAPPVRRTFNNNNLQQQQKEVLDNIPISILKNVSSATVPSSASNSSGHSTTTTMTTTTATTTTTGNATTTSTATFTPKRSSYSTSSFEMKASYNCRPPISSTYPKPNEKIETMKKPSKIISKASRRVRRYSSPRSSRYCHLCARHQKSVKMVGCSNVHQNICQKSVCVKCIDRYGLSSDTNNWVCPHCENKCPPRAKCFAYDRQTAQRRERTILAKGSTYSSSDMK